MDDRRGEHAKGIRPPNAYAIEIREPVDGAIVLGLAGEFDLSAADALSARLEAARQAARLGAVLDCAELTFVDSSGLRELLVANDAFRADGKTLALAAPQPAVVRLLELTGVASVLLTAPTLERALGLVAERA